MTEAEIRIAVEKIIKESNLVAEIIECEEEEENHFIVRVEVDRKDYDRAMQLRLQRAISDNYHISWWQKCPELVGAEVGDLVLIYDENESEDSESDVGLVSAKYTEENGDVTYGCRYIKVGLNNRWIDKVYDFQLTTENYGGFPVGFLKVVTPDEALLHLKKQLNDALKKSVEEAHARYERSMHSLPKVVAAMAKTKKVMAEQIEIDLPWGISMSDGNNCL